VGAAEVDHGPAGGAEGRVERAVGVDAGDVLRPPGADGVVVAAEEDLPVRTDVERGDLAEVTAPNGIETPPAPKVVSSEPSGLKRTRIGGRS
jgi:hypothetical protein